MQKHIKETYVMCQKNRCGKGIFQNLNLPESYNTKQIYNCHLVSSVGRVQVCCMGVQRFEPQIRPTLMVLK